MSDLWNSRHAVGGKLKLHAQYSVVQSAKQPPSLPSGWLVSEPGSFALLGASDWTAVSMELPLRPSQLKSCTSTRSCLGFGEVRLACAFGDL